MIARMKRIILITFFTLTLGSFIFAQKPLELNKIKVITPPVYCGNVLRESFAVDNFQIEENRTIIDSFPANITNLILSLPEITKDCPSTKSSENRGCSNGVKIIAIFAIGFDKEGDVLTFDFKVSGGKIIDAGERFPIKLRNKQTAAGAKLLWDLSDAEPGTYTITAAVDDGCGFCGRPMTKAVVVKECPSC